ncbi:MAG: alpha/beta fold hydrolase [Candidatus Saccharimonadales bacterium]
MTPDKYTIKEFFLDVGDNHQLYVQDWGYRQAKHPVIFLHGGPGSFCKDKFKVNFNPKTQRVVFFDQRGSGKSLPKGELKNNDSQKMVDDIEKIIQELKLPSVVLTGGSWGSCLALLFGIKYPNRVHGMVLNGIFTARKVEIDYLDNGGFRTFFPDLWDKYASTVPEKYKHNPSEYHYENIFSDDKELAKKSAYAYSEMLEGPLLNLDDRYEPEKFDEFDPDAMKIELHYLKNDCFIPEGYIFKNASKLTMPIWLVQGRYDMVCPPMTAYELNKLLPNSKMIWTISGHKVSRESWALIKLLQEQVAS